MPALAPLFGELPGELRAVDVVLHGFEHQALELGRFECFDLPLDGLADVEAVPAGERRPARVITPSSAAGSSYVKTCSRVSKTRSTVDQQLVRATQSR
ncbi:hypothetical protein ACFYWN_44990 [Streptomyces sp. NPDC002917]|uniref:hypothetical protein n=1 Tax=Streptomyces sp. NPDC002917 TaxID=3364671 RepID=UPI0036B77274